LQANWTAIHHQLTKAHRRAHSNQLDASKSPDLQKAHATSCHSTHCLKNHGANPPSAPKQFWMIGVLMHF